MQKNKNLKNYNTFGIEAFCDVFIEINNNEQLEKIDFTNETLILGGGSNLLITRQLKQVVFINTKGIKKIKENDEYVILKVQAGEIWDDFVDFCVKNNYYGVENLSLIPGTVGASPIQNIGAYGTEIKDIIESVEYYNFLSQSYKNITSEKCNFAYRDSIFKNELKGKVVVTAVFFKLSKTENYNIGYGGIKERFTNNKPTLKLVRQAIIDVRDSKLPDYKLLGNSGSFFKNAIVNRSKFGELIEKFPQMPYFTTPEGFKIPTAWLIENAGLKGFRHKNAGVYDKHSLILVNYGGATAKEILELAQIIENTVLEKFRIKIVKEVNVI